MQRGKTRTLGMHIHAPQYRWRCHKCERVNEANTLACAHCSYPAITSAVEVARTRGEPNPTTEGYKGPGASWMAGDSFTLGMVLTMCMPNSALLTDACSLLRRACGVRAREPRAVG